ncbi:aminoacyl-tRNA hydrolase [Nonomuraea typhae]|uniref:peptidyl-tRNA hydrolase n=1 Tax=Nonomuraea typhae TaxID=2603600 RepID=A0ABW7Z8I3_9ACTN
MNDERELMVLPLVVRLERAAPPERADALEAAAMAVLGVLADPGEWSEELHAWQATGRIRKVVRRARGAEWTRVLALPGRTVAHRTAEVRVHPPIPLDGWPKDLSRLQVSGTDLADTADPGPAVPPVLWENPALEMTAGKAMAQAGHAAQLAWWSCGPAERADWIARGLAVSVRTSPSQEHFDKLAAGGLPVVRDAGFTEIAPGSCTFVAELTT